MYKVVWKEEIKKDLVKIDRAIVKKITDKVKNYLAQDPYNRGEPLSYEYKGYYRYRFSNYRVIYQIKEQELIVLVVKVGHRREVY
jgi:mRNA interferase RelE/StbE